MYKRINNDLIVEKEINFIDVFNGVDYFINLLCGKKKRIRLKQIYNISPIHKIKGKGMPIRRKGRIVGHGDILIKFNCKIPHLKKKDKEKILEIVNTY